MVGAGSFLLTFSTVVLVACVRRNFRCAFPQKPWFRSLVLLESHLCDFFSGYRSADVFCRPIPASSCPIAIPPLPCSRPPNPNPTLLKRNPFPRITHTQTRRNPGLAREVHGGRRGAAARGSRALRRQRELGPDHGRLLSRQPPPPPPLPPAAAAATHQHYGHDQQDEAVRLHRRQRW